jgi:hypothetical protein
MKFVPAPSHNETAQKNSARLVLKRLSELNNPGVKLFILEMVFVQFI